MKRGALWAGAVVVTAAALAACANGLVIQPDADAGADGSLPDGSNPIGDASACPQYDLTKDPQHCGSCTHACQPAEVCSNGQCKAQCDPPLVKCQNDDAGTCADLTKDPAHCGQCTTACSTADAGALPPGNGNPDSGVFFDGGYDGGTGWSLGTASCANSACGVTCPQGMTECADGICYDTQNFHDHCGDCNTACAADTEWCDQGHCCAVGQEVCNGACVDVQSDTNNCGGCGVTCNGNTPVCSAGQCTAATTFTDTFTQGQVATQQCIDWNAFRTKLTGTYTSITLSGSNDQTGRTCTGAGANTLCQALHNGTTVAGLSCGGYTWNVDFCSGMTWELSADATTCSCNGTYNVRPCINTNGDWGGINGPTCQLGNNGTQTITVVCK